MKYSSGPPLYSTQSPLTWTIESFVFIISDAISRNAIVGAAELTVTTSTKIHDLRPSIRQCASVGLRVWWSAGTRRRLDCFAICHS